MKISEVLIFRSYANYIGIIQVSGESGQIAAVWIHAKYQADGSKVHQMTSLSLSLSRCLTKPNSFHPNLFMQVQHYGFYDITEAFSSTMTKDVRFLGG